MDESPSFIGDNYEEIIERCLAKQNVGLSPRDRIDIYLGLDLGTSYTKVVWRLGQKARPVCFGQNPDQLEDYLVPSIVYFDGKRFQTSLDGVKGPAIGSEYAIPNFKICLACESDKTGRCGIGKCPISNWNTELFPEETRFNEVGLVTSMFLASVLSRSKQIILNTLGFSNGLRGKEKASWWSGLKRAVRMLDLKGFQQKEKVRWGVNLCVPSKYLDKAPMAAGFDTALKTAWLMSLVMDEVPISQSSGEIINYYNAARRLVGKSELDCFVYSEVAAEVASITLSRTSQDGLYAFVDIGAGTVDASVFRFYRRPFSDRTHNEYAADVLQSGSAYIESKAVTWLRKKRLFISDQKTSGNGASGKAAELRLRERLKRMKERGGQILDEGYSIEVESLRRALYEASQYIQRKVSRELIHLFKEAFSKQPRLKFWRDLRLILGGGGASSPAYRDAAVWAFTVKENPKKEPELIDLPKPGDFEMGKLHRKYFHRFAVAYGLSHRNVDLPEVTSPSQISPQSVSREPILISAPSKDEC
jgi:hypothetical protein